VAVYTNAYKGRANRQESATHLSDEFDRIEAAFVSLTALNASYSQIFTHIVTGGTTLIDPSNGQMQELTLTQDTLIEVRDPITGADATASRVTVIIHGENFKIINGWGPQTWKENGNNDWLWLYTGAGNKAGAVLEFAHDGSAWTCVALTRNDAFGFVPVPGLSQALFPFISDLTDTTNSETLVWTRNSYAGGLDADATWVILPPDQARFTGNRYAKNWISTPKDLQAAGWNEDGALVTTEAGEGQDGGSVDKITFTATNGELAHWMLLHFGRSSEQSDPIKFAISFDAKMAGVVTSGTCRAVIAVMGVDSGSSLKWDRETFNLTGQWRSYGAILDPVTGKNLKNFDLTATAGARTLVKFAIESPPDGLGNPVLIENVNVVVLKEGDAEKVANPIVSTIGASMSLAKTAGSTGTWSDGPKTMTLLNNEFIDFQDSLEIGHSYLISLVRTSGNTCDVRLDDNRIFWKGNSLNASDTSFVKDATFTIQYEGGVVSFHQALGSSIYTVNIYKISGDIGIYGDLNANTISNGVINYTQGAQISSNIAVGVVHADDTVINLLGTDEHRTFSKWEPDRLAPMLVRRSEYGVDARPSHGTIIEDNSTSVVRYIAKVISIPLDTKMYVFSIYVRKTFNGNTQIVFPESDGIVTTASKYVDIALTMLGGTPQFGYGVRVNLREATITAPSANDYDILSGTNFQKWIHVFVGYRNNGTNNQAVMQVFPAAGTSTSSQLLTTTKGWAIVDWAQLEDASLRLVASDITIPGHTRGAESVATALADGILYDSNPVQVGNVTGGVFSFNDIEIYKNITWIKS